MKKIFIISMFVVATSVVASAQVRVSLDQVRKIKPLETNRSDVQRLLSSFVFGYQDEDSQKFLTEDISVEVTYSTGKCADDPDDDEHSGAWNIAGEKVVRIKVNFRDEYTAKDIGVDLSKFTREQTYSDSEEFTFHDKVAGVAIEQEEDLIDTLTIFPAKGAAGALCKDNQAGREFYARASWFDKKLKDRHCCVLFNKNANVTDLSLDQTLLEASTGKRVTVQTVAVDPEWDPLTYNYTVTAGRIIGTGAKVVWDLTSVSSGTFSITAGVDDGCGICGKTITKTVTIK